VKVDVVERRQELMREHLERMRVESEGKEREKTEKIEANESSGC